MREKLYSLIKPRSEETKYGKAYDVFMIVVICTSLIPLMFKDQTTSLVVIDKITVCIFIVDYIFRWAVADYLLNVKGVNAFLRYPFTLMAILDLLSILPSLVFVFKGLKALRLLRLIKALKVIRVFRSFRYSKNVDIIVNVFKKQKNSLVAVIIFALGYIFVTALIMFQAETATFNTFFDAIYWATISLTTVGYGDIFATSVFGKIITMISALVGIAIVALPAGIITAGYMTELENLKLGDEE